MGDALAVCLLDYKGFSSKDFAKYHPGGALGKKLYLKVKDIFPFAEWVSNDLDYEKFTFGLLQQPKVWIRVKNEFAEKVKKEDKFERLF